MELDGGEEGKENGGETEERTLSRVMVNKER